ncbi:hypothetical protein AX15_007554 [Amanita polypyramis BW_CC]|nr:hypothetical protein AX15_007554 [Amanita polypyramis BW_CC]
MFTSVLAVNIAQFFPSIQAHIVVEIYCRQGFPEHLVQFLSSYLKDRTTTYSLGTGTSELFNMNSGIPQGCKICPIAACLYIAPVLKTLLPWDPQSQQFLLSFINDTALSTCFDPELSFKSHVDSWTTKASTSLRACKMLGNSQRGLTPKDKWLIYLTTCLPILTYGFQLWYQPKGKGCKQLLCQMDKVHRAAARWITGGFPDSPHNALLSISSLELLQINLDRLSYHTVLRLIMLHPASGIAKGHKPIQTLSTQSAGCLHIQGDHIYTEPSFSKGRISAKLGPLSALRNIPLPTHKGQHFDDDAPPGSCAIDLYCSQIQTLAIPTKPKDADETAFEEWKALLEIHYII